MAPTCHHDHVLDVARQDLLRHPLEIEGRQDGLAPASAIGVPGPREPCLIGKENAELAVTVSAHERA